ncbi:MAG: MFS transporter [Oscillospiraceae bacterium]|nr:MFS transporter [Oscillospiraceae bacterium]
MGKFKLTKREKSWILYDVGNSAFTMMVSTLIPIFFNALAGDAGISSTNYLAYWGYAGSVATLLTAVIGPVFGTIADRKDTKKRVFLVSLILGAAACILMGFAWSWLAFLVIYVLAKVSYSSSLVFYDAMLPETTTEDRMDNVSSQGYAWGYIGSCVPFIICIVVYVMSNMLNLIPLRAAMILVFLITAVWWVAMSVPLIRTYRQDRYVEAQGNPFVQSFRQLGNTFKSIRQEKHIFLFLLAFFFFIDGVYTIIDMAVAYGTAVGLDTTGLLIALLVTQFVAFPCAIIFGRLAAKYDTGRLIKICIVAYTCITIFAIFLAHQWQFWVLAVCVGMFQGGIQALSRSYFGKIIPAEKSGEYFGLYDICGKGAAFMGTTLMAAVTQLTGHQNIGVGSIVIIFAAGLLVFTRADKACRAALAK